MARAREPLNFGEQLERLEEIVRRLEGEELDLDAALKLFEEGVERLRQARERLTAAEAQVKQSSPIRRGKSRVETPTPGGAPGGELAGAPGPGGAGVGARGVPGGGGGAG